MLYINREYYVRESIEDDKFYVCDQEGIANDEGLEHVGDCFATLEEAIEFCDELVESNFSYA